jgi:putative membrane protein
MTGQVLAQMWGDGDHMDGWGWGWLMMLVLVVVVGLVVWGIVRSTQHPTAHHPHDRAREILAERLASGEITPDEYQERVAHLR